jgi:protocatechuate 3,4-dioxygenase beta subunit
VRLPTAIRTGILSAILLAGLEWPAGAQVTPPPPPPRPAVPSQVGQPPRDPGRRPPPEPVGTGVIRGMVVSETGTPIRKANVNLMPMPTPPPPGTPPVSGVVGGVVGGGRGGVTTTQTVMVNGVPTQINVSSQMSMARPRTMTTDAQGAFAFTGLPAGSYRVMASPGQYTAQYLSMTFGAKKPNGPMSSDMGQTIQLGNGQAFEKATIVLPRGSVITGRVTDENGDPLARVQVYTLLYPPGNPRGMRTGGGDSTDDLGQFRIYGLAPGDYVVAAEARPNTFVQPNAAPESEEDKIGYMTSFYPGTPDEAAAQRVRVRGGETPGIEIRVVSGRLYRVSGMVTDSKGGAGRVNGSLSKASLGNQSSYGFSTDEQGRFQMKNIPPGNYRLTVRQNQTGPRNPDGSPVDQGEFASVPLMITGDLEDLLVTTNPGVTITGQIVYEHGPPQPQPNQTAAPVVRVNAQMGDPMNNMGMGIPMPQPAVVGPELTFTMKGLMGELLLRSSAPMQYLKSVTVNGADITDTPREFKSGDKVTITLSSRASMVEGNVTDNAGAPVTDAGLILFSDDKASWRSNSIKTRRTGVDPNGHYRMPGLLPGRYFIIAVPRDRLNMSFGMMDVSMFEELSKEATSLVVGDDEQRQVDLKVVVSSGGH